jgi:non-heme chloroperoxidase
VVLFSFDGHRLTMKYAVKSVQLPNQVKLPYVEHGEPSGSPLILLHGYADSWRSFERVLPNLPESVHTFALTQRGHGDASRPTAGYTTHDFVGDLVAFMDAIDLNAAVIAGGSSGGFVARRFAIDHPQHTLGLALIGSPLTLRDKPSVLQLWDSTISKLTDPVAPGFVREFVESTLIQPVPQEFLETLVQESLKVPAHIWKATLEGLLEDDSSEMLDQIRAPTLILWGDKDTIVPLSDQETLARAISDSRLVVYRGAGHALNCEEPVRCASDLSAFVLNLVR